MYASCLSTLGGRPQRSQRCVPNTILQDLQHAPFFLGKVKAIWYNDIVRRDPYRLLIHRLNMGDRSGQRTRAV